MQLLTSATNFRGSADPPDPAFPSPWHRITLSWKNWRRSVGSFGGVVCRSLRYQQRTTNPRQTAWMLSPTYNTARHNFHFTLFYLLFLALSFAFSFYRCSKNSTTDRTIS